MRFLKIILYGLLVVITSMYFFPFEFTFLPGVNTKMAMAALGLVLYGANLAKGRTGRLDKAFFVLSLIAVLLSIISYASAVINNTNDYTYASYIVSMWVWLAGAYTVVSCIRLVHKKTSVQVVANYLIAVCVFQCVMAMVIDSVPAVKDIVNRLVLDMGFVGLDKVAGSGRLYGIGCALDVAGTRFAAVLAIIAFLTTRLSKSNPHSYYIWLYMFAYAIIVVIGNMIARTTIVGVIYSFAIWIIAGLLPTNKEESSYYWPRLFVVIIVAVVASTTLYNLSPAFKENLRFAFEGFFSLAEKGYWETNSNNILKSMVVFPESLHTWIIGDGYLEDPFNRDPNYIGQDFHGYYMQTDIGYLRFIFYIGLLGLLTFCIFMVAVAHYLIVRFPKYSWMFFVILMINFTIWFKVSTDIFLVFAIFLCVHKDENDEYEASIALPELPKNETNLPH